MSGVLLVRAAAVSGPDALAEGVARVSATLAKADVVESTIEVRHCHAYEAPAAMAELGLLDVEPRIVEYLANHPHGYLLVATGEAIGEPDGMVCNACGRPVGECRGESPPNRA